jgi:hypothetical protein
MWYTVKKRMDLEIENLSFRGKKYFADRSQFILNNLIPKAALKLGSVKVDGNADLSHLPIHYILEALAVEHAKAMARYVPRPYNGNTLLIRASKQLQAANIEEDLGWKDILCGEVEMCEIRGHQQNLLLPPNVEQLASKLNDCLTTTPGQSSSGRSTRSNTFV